MSQTMERGKVELLSPVQIRAAVGEERKAALEVLAVRNYRSLSAELRIAIDEHLGVGRDETSEDGS